MQVSGDYDGGDTYTNGPLNDGTYEYAVRAVDSAGNVSASGAVLQVTIRTTPRSAGRATFGFVSRYQHGASIPTGQTEFQFHLGNLNFKSTGYDWLVVGGARAKYKGYGKINGQGDYAFMITAIDGQRNGGGGADRFRIKIWNRSGGGVVYDTQMGAPDDDDPVLALGGGSIMIHT